MFRATNVLRYVEAMATQGIGADRLLAGTGLDADTLATPGYLISVAQYEAVVLNIIRLSGDPGIAFSIGKQLTLNDFGIVGYAMLSANSWLEATDIWIKYSNSLVGSPMSTDWHNKQNGYELTFVSKANAEEVRRFETEEFIVQGINVVRDLTGVDPVFGKVSLCYPEPAHRDRYERTLNCPLEFDAPETVVTIVKPTMDSKVRTRNAEMFDICIKHCHQILASLPRSSMLHSRLRKLFLANSGALPSIEAASADLGMSVSTLRRQLVELGLSYQGVKDEFRKDLACEYFRSGHISVKQVAYLLGFRSPSNFSRAFKAWTGKTVGEFMKAQEAGTGRHLSAPHDSPARATY